MQVNPGPPTATCTPVRYTSPELSTVTELNKNKNTNSFINDSTKLNLMEQNTSSSCPSSSPHSPSATPSFNIIDSCTIPSHDTPLEKCINAQNDNNNNNNNNNMTTSNTNESQISISNNMENPFTITSPTTFKPRVSEINSILIKKSSLSPFESWTNDYSESTEKDQKINDLPAEENWLQDYKKLESLKNLR